MDSAALSEAVKASLSKINNLESSSDNWELLVHIFSALVVIGVVMELIIICREYNEGLEKWREGVIRSPERPDRRLFVIGLIGAGLVALGVAGEVSVGVHIGTLQTALRDENRKLNDIALTAASEAMIRAAELEAQIQPRYLTKENQDSIRLQVARFSGTDFFITSHRTDPESKRLAQQIKSALIAAGMGNPEKVDGIAKFPAFPFGMLGGFQPDETIHEGVEVWGSNDAAVKAVVAALASVSAKRISRPESSENFSEKDPVAIFVGLKPGVDPSAVSVGLEVAIVRAEVADRRIGQQQKETLAANLKKLPPMRVAIVSKYLDVEATRFADDINSVISERVRWQTVRNPNLITEKLDGVLLAVASETNKEYRDGLAEFSKVLTDSRIVNKVETLPWGTIEVLTGDFEKDVVYLLVGQKPNAISK